MSKLVRPACLVLSSAWLLASHVIAGHRIIVDTGGTGDYFRIQRAVDGDTILVKEGTCPGLTISDKRVYVVAEYAHAVNLNGTEFVMNLAASRDAVIARLLVQGSGLGLHLASNAGSVRVQACSIFASSLTGSQLHGAFVADCSDVAFASCVLEGGVGDFISGSGLRATGSNVALYDCIGPGADGQDEASYCPARLESGRSRRVRSRGVVLVPVRLGIGPPRRPGRPRPVELRLQRGRRQRRLRPVGRFGLRDERPRNHVHWGPGGSRGCGPMVCGDDGLDRRPTTVFGGATLTTLPGTARKLTMPTPRERLGWLRAV
ncbi:MAG: hypothetical protein ACKVXR_18340 [Planctomycetota bacterium]